MYQYQTYMSRDPGIKTCPSQISPGHLVPLSEERQTRVPIKLTTVRIDSVKVQNASRPKRLDLDLNKKFRFWHVVFVESAFCEQFYERLESPVAKINQEQNSNINYLPKTHIL